MMQAFDVLIVGSGHGGAEAAIALRELGFAGTIGMVGADPDPPYQRPLLSKDYLAGERSLEQTLIRPAGYWSEHRIDLQSGREVVAVNPRSKRVELRDGAAIGYGSLIWAAGGAPRRLACAGGDLAGVHSIRHRSDVDRILAELQDGAKRVVIVGGGYIGLEAASVLGSRGAEIVLLEALDRVLARVAGETIGRFYEAEHRARGIDLRTGATVSGFFGEAGRVTGVTLGDGSRLPADLVIVGIGISAAATPLAEAGAATGNGVHVDAHCHTSLDGIYAIGDCAAHENRFAGGYRIRLESVQNAQDQARVAAKAIMGVPEPYCAVPRFWSDQYDLKLQSVGLFHDHDEALVRGDPASRRFSVIYLREGRVIALDCVNAVKDFVQGRALVIDRAMAVRHLLADPAHPLKLARLSEAA
jgi:3-phenylpropionate/trans-cinnamate dioxygenase ferredoxin reductase subunit